MRVPDTAEIRVGRGVGQAIRKRARCSAGGEGAVEIIQVERFQIFSAADEGVLQFAAQPWN